jgi:hypothetical protein
MFGKLLKKAAKWAGKTLTEQAKETILEKIEKKPLEHGIPRNNRRKDQL